MSSWATHSIAILKEGKTAVFRPRGNSMVPIIKSGQRCTVEPVDPATLRKGDVVLCRVRGVDYLHLISAIEGERVQISNNQGHVNGWTHQSNVYGKLTKVDP